MNMIYSDKNLLVKKATVICICLCIILVFIDSIYFNTSFFKDSTHSNDGAYHQYIHIKDLLEDDKIWKEIFNNPIIALHFFRYAIYKPFIFLNELQIPLEYTLLVLISFPVIRIYYKNNKHIIFIAPLVFAYFISFRAILCAISIGYLIIYLFNNRNFIYLVSAILLSFLSSAVLVQSLLLIIFFMIFRENFFLYSLKNLLIIPYFLLAILVLIEKLSGFYSGIEGYMATSNIGNENNIFWSIFSRSTLYYNLQLGNIRGYFYLLFGIFFLILITKKLFSKNEKYKDYRLILPLLSIGFLVEGLGVISILMVIIWAYMGVDLTNSSKYVVLKRNY